MIRNDELEPSRTRSKNTPKRFADPRTEVALSVLSGLTIIGVIVFLSVRGCGIQFVSLTATPAMSLLQTPTPTLTPIPGPLDFELEWENWYFTEDGGKWGATLVVKIRGGQPPYRYTIDEVFEFEGPRYVIEWKTGTAMVRSIQVIDANGVTVSKPLYEPPRYKPTPES